MKTGIERSIELNAPVERVWIALTDYREFATWFRLDLHEPFRVGQVTRGEVTYPGHEGLPFWARVEILEAPRRFSFVWPVDETVQPDDPDMENKVTLVEFIVEASAAGTKLTIRESGFEKLPESKRLPAFRDHEGGWKLQMENIKIHVE